MATVPITPVPRTNSVLQKAFDFISYHWDNWFQSLANALNLGVQQVGSVALTGQHATVNATAIATMPTPLSAGLYRLTYYARVTQVATSSSSLTPRFTWTDGLVVCSSTRAAITGNTTATTQGEVFPIQIDAGSTVTYTLTYASSGVQAMQYAFRARLEALP